MRKIILRMIPGLKLLSFMEKLHFLRYFYLVICMGNSSLRLPEVLSQLLKIRKFSRGLYFRETSHMRSFVKIKPSRNGKITLSFIDKGKSCLICVFFTSLICLLMLFAKIKFSRKFPNLQYLIIISTHNI